MLLAESLSGSFPNAPCYSSAPGLTSSLLDGVAAGDTLSFDRLALGFLQCGHPYLALQLTRQNFFMAKVGNIQHMFIECFNSYVAANITRRRKIQFIDKIS